MFQTLDPSDEDKKLIETSDSEDVLKEVCPDEYSSLVEKDVSQHKHMTLYMYTDVHCIKSLTKPVHVSSCVFPYSYNIVVTCIYNWGLVRIESINSSENLLILEHCHLNMYW